MNLETLGRALWINHVWPQFDPSTIAPHYLEALMLFRTSKALMSLMPCFYNCCSSQCIYCTRPKTLKRLDITFMELLRYCWRFEFFLKAKRGQLDWLHEERLIPRPFVRISQITREKDPNCIVSVTAKPSERKFPHVKKNCYEFIYSWSRGDRQLWLDHKSWVPFGGIDPPAFEDQLPWFYALFRGMEDTIEATPALLEDDPKSNIHHYLSCLSGFDIYRDIILPMGITRLFETPEALAWFKTKGKNALMTLVHSRPNNLCIYDWFMLMLEADCDENHYIAFCIETLFSGGPFNIEIRKTLCTLLEHQCVDLDDAQKIIQWIGHGKSGRTGGIATKSVRDLCIQLYDEVLNYMESKQPGSSSLMDIASILPPPPIRNEWVDNSGAGLYVMSSLLSE